MVMFATLRRSGGIEALARHLLLTPAETIATAENLLPHVLGAYRARYDEAGGGTGGVAAVIDLIRPLGGGHLAIEILTPDPIAPARGQEVLRRLIPSPESTNKLIAAARQGSALSVERFEAMLPLLVMLVGGYLTARVESAAESGEDIVAEFERLLVRQSPKSGSIPAVPG